MKFWMGKGWDMIFWIGKGWDMIFWVGKGWDIRELIPSSNTRRKKWKLRTALFPAY